MSDLPWAMLTLPFVADLLNDPEVDAVYNPVYFIFLLGSKFNV